MGTQITITTDDAGLAADLIALINGIGTVAEVAAPPATKAPAKKAAAKKAAAPAPDPVVEDVEEADEDLIGEDETEYTMADAVARATELVQASKADVVKAALADIGVAKVSHLKEPQIAEFMSAVAGA
jgi:hypothetical protein